MHPYIPHTQADVTTMLESMNLSSLDDLFQDIDTNALLSAPLNLPEAHSEQALMAHMRNLADENAALEDFLNFAGGGIYNHYLPSIVAHLTSRSEFYTAYTPYQPEISQGTLQAIFEYQTMISELTGLPVSNASHYDGATALAEAAFMASTASRGNVIVVSDLLNPMYKEVVATYLNYKGLELISSDLSQEHILELMDTYGKKLAAVIVQTPDYKGNVTQLSNLSNLIHDSSKALLIVATNPMSLGLYEAPGALGADIVVGDGQVFGNPMNYGGPSLGFIACTDKLMRKMPGRIVGQTVDLDGNRGYVLTLQAREQHIRREKATSNITSNQALNALAATIYLSLLGPVGLKEVARRSRINAHYLKDQLIEAGAKTDGSTGEFFNEFVIEVPNARDFMDLMAAKKIVAGIMVDDHHILIATTEVLKKDDLNYYVESFKEVLA